MTFMDGRVLEAINNDKQVDYQVMNITSPGEKLVTALS